ncbi:MAG: bifunctional demethylmenaquinone methyltransferase/2-methoxy-6-polyprenyl-1,4-benzoquinol methylase UbiE [candidate division NC10 bacterium]|nr:bifunctional demethylmenaquinone methyltransferase/2-methoxy-6-polyprenyl-1,4-benzoquinol methylase UbiE [candidate division NC10 bacterium]
MGSDLAGVKREEIRRMFASIVHRYDLINRLLSLRRDVYWRRVAVAQGQIPPGGRTLDLCAGTADVALEIIRQVPGAHVIAVDNCEPMLIRGMLKARRAGVADHVRFVAAPAELLPFPDESFDGAFVAFGIRNVADRRRGLAEMARVLRRDGRVVILEFSAPASPLFRSLYHFYSHRIMPWIGGLLSGNRAAYEYLPTSVDGFPSPAELRALMEEVGFFEVSYLPLTFGIATIHYGRKAEHRG